MKIITLKASVRYKSTVVRSDSCFPKPCKIVRIVRDPDDYQRAVTEARSEIAEKISEYKFGSIIVLSYAESSVDEDLHYASKYEITCTILIKGDSDIERST